MVSSAYSSFGHNHLFYVMGSVALWWPDSSLRENRNQPSKICVAQGLIVPNQWILNKILNLRSDFLEASRVIEFRGNFTKQKKSVQNLFKINRNYKTFLLKPKSAICKVLLKTSRWEFQLGVPLKTYGTRQESLIFLCAIAVECTSCKKSRQ